MDQALRWRGTNSLETKPLYSVQMNKEAGLLTLVGDLCRGEVSDCGHPGGENLKFILPAQSQHPYSDQKALLSPESGWRKPVSSHKSEALGSLHVYAHVRTSSAPHNFHVKAEAESFKSELLLYIMEFRVLRQKDFPNRTNAKLRETCLLAEVGTQEPQATVHPAVNSMDLSPIFHLPHF